MANPYIKQSILPGEWDTQIKNVERDRVLAQQLAKDAGRFQKGDMVGQVYVPPSWTQYLAQILQGRQAGVERDRADKRENDILTNKRDTYSNATKALAEALNPKQVQVGETSAMPAYESNQMDRFGSPLPDVQRQPVVTPQYEMKRPAPQDIFKAQMEYGQAIGDPNAISQSVGNIANYGVKLEERDYNAGEKLKDREYNDTREEKIYTRNLADKRADTESDREFQRIMLKEQQGFQLTQQERQFAQQWKMQQSSQGFQAGENQKTRNQALNLKQMEIDAKKAENGGIDWKYDAQSDEFVAPPTKDFPMGRRSGNIAKSNAGKSMDYIINQFRGDYDAQGKPVIVNGKPKNTGAINEAMQGGIMGATGIAGAVFDSQDKRRFDNLKEQMSTELRTLFRIPGEGTLSDKEQAQYGIQLPDVKNSKTTNNKILNDIENRVRLRNNLNANPLVNAPSAPKVVDW